MTKRPYRLALSVKRPPESREDWLRSMQLADHLGIPQVVLGDHVADQRYASVPALAAASGNSRLRFGTSVFQRRIPTSGDFGDDLATLHARTGGRFELGLGAGWMATTYGTTGIIRERIDRQAESVQIIRRLFGVRPGHVRETPLPGRWSGGMDQTGPGLSAHLHRLRQPAPPTYGRPSCRYRRSSTRASRQGLWCRFRPEFGRFDERRRWVESARERIGQIELNRLVHGVFAANDPQAPAEPLASQYALSAAEGPASPYFLIGPIAKIDDDPRPLRESLEISYFNLRYADAHAITPVLEILRGS